MRPLQYKSFEVHISNEPTYSFGSTDNVQTFERETRLDSGEYQHSSAHGVTVVADETVVASHLVGSSGGATGVHGNSALIVNDKCIVAVGPYVTAFGLPSLDIAWSRQADEATVFGIHLSADQRFLLSHGELAISRMGFDGQIEWQAGGADIFTEGFAVHETYVRAVDFEHREYWFNLDSGTLISP